MLGESHRREYWIRNLTYVGVLLAVWFVVSYGFGILWVVISLPGLGGTP